MRKYLISIMFLVLSANALASDSFDKNCDRHLRSEQSAVINQSKQMIADYRKQLKTSDEHAQLDALEKQFDDKINNQIKSMCTCMKDKTVSSLKVTGLSDEEISASLRDLGKAMIHQNYFMIDEVTRKSFEQAALCSL